jgi:hypothetical protein
MKPKRKARIRKRGEGEAPGQDDQAKRLEANKI